MTRNVEEPESCPELTEGRVISFSYFLERLIDRSRGPAHKAEPRRMIMWAEQAHEADQIAQAESLIEAAYALYDQCICVAGEKGLTSTTKDRSRNVQFKHP